MNAIAFDSVGNGTPIIFIHGFPLNRKIWSDFTARFSNSHKVVTVDLPGFGDSQNLPSPISLDTVGLELIGFLKQHELTNGVVIGHSLGGYVSLAMIRHAPELFRGLVLFHSTSYPDSDEKKQSRDKAVSFIKKNGVKAFTSNFITPLFADQNHPKIAHVRAISSQASEQTVVDYTMAMRDRPATTETLKHFKPSVLFIGGDRDGGISVQSLYEQAAVTPAPEVFILRDVAHMGMFEKPGLAAEKISSFISKT